MVLSIGKTKITKKQRFSRDTFVLILVKNMVVKVSMTNSVKRYGNGNRA